MACDPFARNWPSQGMSGQVLWNLDNLVVDVGCKSPPVVSAEMQFPSGSDGPSIQKAGSKAGP